jgi:thioredoxin
MPRVPLLIDPSLRLMDKTTFIEKLKNNPRPVVVDVWAPWCMPCRSMAPALDRVGQKYAGQVDLWKLNPDEDPELARALRVMSIPTMIAFQGDVELNRFTGTQNEEMLTNFFDAALSGEVRKQGIAPFDRTLRLLAGTALAITGWWAGQNLLLIVLGGLLAFSAIYDRCPIYQAVSTRIKALFNSN